ncbi:MAG: transposase [Nitrospira defluvii]|nr:transposase [Nitrospira defluvii]
MPMLATPAFRRVSPLKRMATLPMSKGAGRRPRRSGGIRRSDARRWIVEVAHSWFNRFRKLLVREEKLERSFLGLTHLAAAIITFRKVPLAINVLYG